MKKHLFLLILPVFAAFLTGCATPVDRNKTLASIEQYSQAIKLNPKEPSNYLNRALQEMGLSDYYDAAISDADKTIELAPNYAHSGTGVGPSPSDQLCAMAYVVRSQVEQKKGDLSGAKLDAAKAIALAPATRSFFSP